MFVEHLTRAIAAARTSKLCLNTATLADATAHAATEGVRARKVGTQPKRIAGNSAPTGSARSLLAVMPLRVSERLAEHGIDAGFFSGAKGENLDEVMRELNIDVYEGKGKKVRIFCE